MPKHELKPQGKSNLDAASLGGGYRSASGAPPPGGGLSSRSSSPRRSPSRRTCPTPPLWSTRTRSSSCSHPTSSGYRSPVGSINAEGPRDDKMMDIG